MKGWGKNRRSGKNDGGGGARQTHQNGKSETLNSGWCCWCRCLLLLLIFPWVFSVRPRGGGVSVRSEAGAGGWGGEYAIEIYVRREES